jgi:hypothetical protein
VPDQDGDAALLRRSITFPTTDCRLIDAEPLSKHGLVFAGPAANLLQATGGHWLEHFAQYARQIIPVKEIDSRIM